MKEFLAVGPPLRVWATVAHGNLGRNPGLSTVSPKRPPRLLSSFALIFPPTPPPDAHLSSCPSSPRLPSRPVSFPSLLSSFFFFLPSHAAISRSPIGDLVAHDEDDKTRQAVPQGLFFSCPFSTLPHPTSVPSRTLWTCLRPSSSPWSSRPTGSTSGVSPILSPRTSLLRSSSPMPPHLIHAAMMPRGILLRSNSPNQTVDRIPETHPAS